MILDDHCLDTVLSFARDIPARGSCKKWASHLYDALLLERTMQVRKRLNKEGSITFDYIAARDLGPEITESIAFHFAFYPTGKYNLKFSHTYHEDLADVCVDMTGSWHAERGEFICQKCETPKVPTLTPPKEGHAHSPPPVVRFTLPIELVLAGSADPEETALRWEHSIVSRSLLLDTSSESESKLLEVKLQPEDDEDSSYVEVDGRTVRVCNDIRENHPEASWQNLMSVRVRVGLV